MDALGDATEAHKRYAETRSKLANDETHRDESVQSKADLIEYLYTDEAEHQEEIQRLWENRHKRLERR